MSKLEKIERNRDRINIDADDVELIARLCAVDTDVIELATGSGLSAVETIELKLSRGSTLDRSHKKNWVENEGGLPKKIEDLAKALVRSGKSIQTAIQIAVGRAKVYAATLEDPKKRAEWAAAVAQWEKMKASSKAKTAAKKK